MDNNTVITAVIGVIFLVLALVAIFRFDKVKHSLEIFGIKMGISGSRNTEKQKRGAQSAGEPARSQNASIKVGGNVTESTLSAESPEDSQIDVKKNVKKSKLQAKGGK